MKEASPAAARKASKDKKQLVVLGALGVVLAIVLFTQFGGGDADDDGAGAEVAAAAERAAPSVGSTAMSLDEASAPAVPDNEVLSDDGAESDSLRVNAFTQFWRKMTDEPEPELGEPQVAMPTIQLLGTSPSGSMPLAIIDGRVRRVGDSVQGWTLNAIQARSVQLKSPSNELVTVEMPLLDPMAGSVGGGR